MAINKTQKCAFIQRLLKYDAWANFQLQQMGVSIGSFIAGVESLNFSHLYQRLQFKMLKKFVLQSASVVEHVLQ